MAVRIAPSNESITAGSINRIERQSEHSGRHWGGRSVCPYQRRTTDRRLIDPCRWHSWGRRWRHGCVWRRTWSTGADRAPARSRRAEDIRSSSAAGSRRKRRRPLWGSRPARTPARPTGWSEWILRRSPIRSAPDRSAIRGRRSDSCRAVRDRRGAVRWMDDAQIPDLHSCQGSNQIIKKKEKKNIIPPPLNQSNKMQPSLESRNAAISYHPSSRLVPHRVWNPTWSAVQIIGRFSSLVRQNFFLKNQVDYLGSSAGRKSGKSTTQRKL